MVSTPTPSLAPLSAPSPLEAPTLNNFFVAVLTGLHLPVTQDNVDALKTVSQLEGQNSYYNPLNYVVPFDGSTPYNTAGVQEYKSFDDGVHATIQLLSQSNTSSIRNALKDGNNKNSVLSAFDNFYASWGSHVNLQNFQPANGNRSVGPVGGTGKLTGIIQNAVDPTTGGTTTGQPQVINHAAFTPENTSITTTGTQNEQAGWGWLGYVGDVTDPIGSLLGVDPLHYLADAGNVVGDVKDAITLLANVMGFIAQAFKEFLWLFQPGHFIKFLLYVGGVGAVLTGIYFMIKGSGEDRPA